jgi:hypothetical protein
VRKTRLKELRYPVPYGDLAHQAGGVSKETVEYGLSSTGLEPESDCSVKVQKQLYE